MLFFLLLLIAACVLGSEREAEWHARASRIPALAPHLAARSEADDLDRYATPADTSALIRAVAAGPTPSSVVDLGASARGREVLGIRLGLCAGGTCADRPTVVYFGPVHGDERVGGELFHRLIAHVRDHFATPAVQALLFACNLVVVPHPNPDGFHTLRRGLDNDVDMNRAFFPDRCNTSNPYEDLGPQPEVEHTKAFFLAEQPVAALLMHGGALVVSYPHDDECERHGTRVEAPAPDNLLYMQLARNYSAANSMMARNLSPFRDHITNGAFWYSLSGGLQDWTLGHVPSMVVPLTVEVSSEKMPSYAEVGRRFWGANFPALMTWPVALRQGVWGTVAQDDGLAPEGATVYVFAGQRRRSLAERDGKAVPVRADGRFFRPLATGTWEVCVSKPLYTAACVQVTVRRGENTPVHIQLHVDTQ